MFCSQCGKQHPDDAKFCSGCGAAVNGGNVQSAPVGNGNVQSVVTAVAQKPKKISGTLISIVAVAIVFVAGAVVFLNMQSRQQLQIVSGQETVEAEKPESKVAEDKTEQERLEAVRLEAERLEAERLEAERLEAERLEAERLEAERLEAERLEAERLEAERIARSYEDIDYTIQAFARARTDGNADIAAKQWVDNTPGGHLGRTNASNNISVEAGKVGGGGLGSLTDWLGGGISHAAGWTLTIDYNLDAITIDSDTTTITIPATMTEESVIGTYVEKATIYMREVDGKWLIESISGGTGLW